MKSINIPRIPDHLQGDIPDLSKWMDALPRIPIDNNPWPDYNADTDARFSIAYTEDQLLLKYYVQEDQFKASVREINDDVYKDNCVECFIAFNDEQAYYNIELNCLGSAKIGYGTGRADRVDVPDELIKKITINVSLDLHKKEDNLSLSWTIFAIIPKQLFLHSPILSFAGITAKGNFYKCGDDLPKPHFLTWAPVQGDQPDFHQSQYFGELIFGK
ncbi:hypothetical protein IM792_01435 [Mucilaginibacter sp. JRF]|uniref:carbohydrate-binding family 9-like protein n=1 Tax=Mucilaginibacter sp. JRF TaxID=2780088 RepID=UPI00187FFA3A|nr:carbohydrate-binding family 9-like protein [Mucilaginibacter sp. JRF]MBE9583101.1 hypothetical protein [Mucilaginibacter sp. JRF]